MRFDVHAAVVCVGCSNARVDVSVFSWFAGLGVGDALLLKFNQPVAQVNVSSKASIDAVLQFTPSTWASNYTGLWLDMTALLITVRAVGHDVDRHSVAVGALNISVLASGGLTSFDGTSPASNDSVTVSSGSWGDVVCDASVMVYSYRGLQVSFTPPVTAAGWSPTSYTIEYSAVSTFAPSDPSTGQVSVDVSAGNDRSMVVLVLSQLTLGVSYYVRVAASPLASVPRGASLPYPLQLLFVQLPGYSCAALGSGAAVGAAPAPIAIAPQLPVIDDVSTPLGGIPTAGGVSVTIVGTCGRNAVM